MATLHVLARFGLARLLLASTTPMQQQAMLVAICRLPYQRTTFVPAGIR
jgi:hypothetical protein